MTGQKKIHLLAMRRFKVWLVNYYLFKSALQIFLAKPITQSNGHRALSSTHNMSYEFSTL